MAETTEKQGKSAGRQRLGFSLTEEAQRLLKGLRDKQVITQNVLIELVIREKAARWRGVNA